MRSAKKKDPFKYHTQKSLGYICLGISCFVHLACQISYMNEASRPGWGNAGAAALENLIRFALFGALPMLLAIILGFYLLIMGEKSGVAIVVLTLALNMGIFICCQMVFGFMTN